jgi:NADP oxidoreductase coenzyme F420-dependent
MSTISIIGTGGMAAAIGGLAAKAGHTVELMSRDAAKARALAEKVGAGATTGTFGAAPSGVFVLFVLNLAVFSAAPSVVSSFGIQLLSGGPKASAITYLPEISDRATLTGDRRCQAWNFAMWDRIACPPDYRISTWSATSR